MQKERKIERNNVKKVVKNGEIKKENKTKNEIEKEGKNN